MGCGGGQKAAKPQEQYQVEPHEEYEDNTAYKTTKSPPVASPIVAVPLPSREKICPAPLIKDICTEEATYVVSHYAPEAGLHGVVFAVYNRSSNVFHYTNYSDSDFALYKEKNLPTGWNIVWRSICSAFTKEEGLQVRNGGRTIEISFKKEKGFTFTVELDVQKNGSLWEHFIEPFSESYHRKKVPNVSTALHSPDKKSREMKEVCFNLL